MVQMHGGLPSPALFPLSAISLTCADPDTAAQAATHPATHSSHLDRTHVASGSMTVSIEDPAAITGMQQYNLNMRGHPELRAWLKNLVYRTQKPARDDLELMLVPSCNASLDAFLHMLVERGESVLVEEHMYPAVRASSWGSSPP